MCVFLRAETKQKIKRKCDEELVVVNVTNSLLHKGSFVSSGK